MKPVLARIADKVNELRDYQTIPKSDQATLEERFKIVWKDGGGLSDISTRQKRRLKLARNVYHRVLSENSSLFLPFILELSPRNIETFTKIDELFAVDRLSRCRLELSNDARRICEQIASRNGFEKCSSFTNFTRSLFDKDEDFQLVQEIMRKRGYGMNPRCLELLNILFPDSCQELAIARSNADEPPQQIQHQQNEHQMARRHRELHYPKYMFSKVPVDRLQLLGEPLCSAIQNSNYYQQEQKRGELTSDCYTSIFPKDPNEDMSITLLVGRQQGEALDLKLMVQVSYDDEAPNLIQAATT